MREHTLEKAMQCFDYIGGSAIGAKAALDDGGYIWRGLDQRTGATTQWNVSWVALDDTSGWVLFELTGEPTSENCTYLDKGSFEELASYNRESIPAVANISALEERLSDAMRYPQLSGAEGVFDAILIDGIAVQGNAVSAEQAHLIDKLGCRVIVCPDRDEAGKDLINQAIELGWEVSFPDWHPSCKDAADAVARYGRVATLQSIIDSATNNKIKIEVKAKML